MQEVPPGQTNEVGLPIVAKLTGGPITSGVINFYLVRLDTKKWFKGSDSTWKSTENLAGTGTYRADGHWYIDLVSAAWVVNTRYRLYAKESGDLHIPVGEEIHCKITNIVGTDGDTLKTLSDQMDTIGAGVGATTMNYYVFEDEDAETSPIADVRVWVTTDSAGNNIVASGYTDNFGKVTFYLDAGTYYMWRKKSGYDFTNPDTEVLT